MATESDRNLGIRVTLAALGINLALGILYTWSVISKGIPSDWNWSEADKSWPYAVACLVFSIVMVPAGRLQDKIGPRIVASAGGLLLGIGCVICSTTTSPMGFAVGFGLLGGIGIACGYASATPPAVKWFPPAKSGRVAGIVVSGFGLASVYAAPLAKWLTSTYGLQRAVLILGIAFTFVVVGLAQLLAVPNKAFQFMKGSGPVGDTKQDIASPPPVARPDYKPTEMLRTPAFYLLWVLFACGAGAGLMVIAKLAMIAKVQAGLELGFLLVAALGVGNGAGRIAAGMLSDKLGRKPVLIACFVIQAVLVLVLSRAVAGSVLANAWVLALISALIGANYGANLSLFPSITLDYYGKPNFGINYGLVFTSWGVGGFMLALIAGKIYDRTKSFDVAYYGAAVLLVIAAVLALTLKPPKTKVAPAAADPR
jgi:OFA family oxalate/formate antiporter-like MFS transporter